MEHLSPAYFALVMATGVISIAAWDFGLFILARGLFVFNVFAYAALTFLTVMRSIRYPQLILSDLTDHRHAPEFFTVVAGSCILGMQFLLLEQGISVATLFFGLGTALWIGLTYTIFVVFTVKRDKPPLEKVLTGAWLIAVVATQSVAVLAASIAGLSRPLRLELNFFALSMWLWGGMLYIWVISLIFYRSTFFVFSPGDLTPPYWINMGAMAISTLAGALLVQNAPGAPFLVSMLPFLKGFIVFYWATATWWIPMLLLLTVWRHLIRRFPLRYDPLYWGAVFPVGMYAVATRQMAEALDLPFLATFPKVFFAAALAMWTLAFIGLAWELIGACRRTDHSAPSRGS
jgi:tellurite resistance protein TehA-like permease